MDYDLIVNKKIAIIEYQGNQISFFSDEFVDYVCVTDVNNVFNKFSQSINSWLTSEQCLLFLKIWETKHNPKFDETQYNHVIELARMNNGLSVETYINLTQSIGIFVIIDDDNNSVTYVHKDIAVKFSAFISSKFEIYLIKEIQRFKEVERKKDSFELLSHEQILYLIRVKDVFKFIVNQSPINNSHKDFFLSSSGLKNPFASFNKLRDELLYIKPKIINKKIRQYCVVNKISETNIVLKVQINEEMHMLDCYESFSIVVWSFLQNQSKINALNFASIVIETKKK